MVTVRKTYVLGVSLALEKIDFNTVIWKCPVWYLTSCHTLFCFVFALFRDLCPHLAPDTFCGSASSQKDINLNATMPSALSPAMLPYTPLFRWLTFYFTKCILYSPPFLSLLIISPLLEYTPSSSTFFSWNPISALKYCLTNQAQRNLCGFFFFFCTIHCQEMPSVSVIPIQWEF